MKKFFLIYNTYFPDSTNQQLKKATKQLNTSTTQQLPAKAKAKDVTNESTTQRLNTSTTQQLPANANAITNSYNP